MQRVLCPVCPSAVLIHRRGINGSELGCRRRARVVVSTVRPFGYVRERAHPWEVVSKPALKYKRQWSRFRLVQDS